MIVLIAGALTAAEVPTRTEARKQLKATTVEVNIERLIQYAGEGDSATVELLLAAGVSVRDADATRKVTPLHNAAAEGHARLVTRFLELGAKIDAQDWQGNTALINAAYYGRADVVEILLARKAQPGIKPLSGPTALIAAVQSGSLPITQKLLTAGADPELADADGQTPLAAAELGGRKDIAALLQSAIAGARP